MNRYRFILLTLIFWVLLPGCSFSPELSASDIRAEYNTARSDIPINYASYNSAVGTNEMSPASPRSLIPLSVDPQDALSAPLSLTRVIDITISNNPDLQQALARISKARALKDLSDAAFWPALGFYTEYMQGDAPSAYLFKKIDQRQLPRNINFNEPGWFENFESGINLRMNLFNSGKDYLSNRMARQDVDISNLERQAVINDLKAQVISTFYDVQASQKFIGIAQASVESVSEQLRIIDVQYKGGSVLKADVLTLQVRLARAKESVVESRNRYKVAKTALAHLMGFDPSDESVDLKITARPDSRFMEIPATFKKGILYAFAHRPELEKTRKLLIKSRIGLDMAKTGYLPRIDLMGKYYMDDPHMKYDRDRENWTAAVILNWDLFTGFSTRARIKKADAAVREMLAAERKATLNIALDVKHAYLNLEATQARYDVAQSSVESAEESYRLVKEHYKGGAVPITRYLDAELDWNRSRIRSTASFYDKIKAAAEFARAIGMLTDGNSTGEGQ